MPELWRLRRITTEFSVTKRTIYNWIKRGEFPKPCKKICGTPYWDAREINKFCKSVKKREKVVEPA